MSRSSSGISGDIMGGLGLLGGGALTLLGMPQFGLPMMLGGAGSVLGGNLGGPAGLGLGAAGGGLAGMGANALGAGQGITSALNLGGPAGGGMAAPPQQTPGLAGAGSPTIGAGLSAPPAAPLSPAGGGADPNRINDYLSAGGGGPAPVPINNAALQQTLGGAPNTQQDFSSTFNDPSNVPWYQNPAYWQGAGSVGAAYLKYLADSGGRQELAHPFSSTVVPTPQNPLAPIRSSPIQPPALVV